MEKVEALEDMVSLAPSSLVKVSYKCWLICFYSYDCEWKQLAENQQCYSGPVWELESDRGAGVRLQDQQQQQQQRHSLSVPSKLGSENKYQGICLHIYF